MTLGAKIRYLREVEGTLRGLGRAMTQQEVVRAVKKELGKSLEIWSAGSSEHRIKDAADYRNHQEYIWNNPVRARLVQRAEDFRRHRDPTPGPGRRRGAARPRPPSAPACEPPSSASSSDERRTACPTDMCTLPAVAVVSVERVRTGRGARPGDVRSWVERTAMHG